MNILDELNPAQRTAAEHADGPLLIIAGAGAGKTKTLTHRIAALISSGVAPEHILAVTFTNKAAREMRERALALCRQIPGTMPPDGKRRSGNRSPFISTFHSLGVHIIKENAALVGLPRHFTIFDRTDSTRAVKRALEEAGMDVKRFEPRAVLNAISWQKGQGIGRREYAEAAAQARGSDAFWPRIVADIWERYERALASDRALDFDDLLLCARDILRDHEDVRHHYQKRWQYLHIDEYQDTNAVQEALITLLAGTRKNICVVGDVDQLIYSWRGAQMNNILSFKQRYPDAAVVTLEENYRSTATILAAADDVISRNVYRHEKRLFTRSNTGEPLRVYTASTEADEAQFVIGEIREQIAAGTPAEEIAVLYRANFQSRILEEYCLRAGIPYQVLGTRFFDRKEVKDLLAYLRAALNERSSVDIARSINEPPRGIGKVGLAKVLAGERTALPARQCASVDRYFALLSEIRAAAQTSAPSEVLSFILRESGLAERYDGGGEEDEERLANMRELVTLAHSFDELIDDSDITKPEALERFLEHAALASDQDSLSADGQTSARTTGVKLMTVHASKGLEFDTVFITGLEEDLFPHSGDDEPLDAEEERRLFYVALTRARRRVYLSHAQTRMIYGSRSVSVPSSFFGEIDASRLETIHVNHPPVEPTISIE